MQRIIKNQTILVKRKKGKKISKFVKNEKLVSKLRDNGYNTMGQLNGLYLSRFFSFLELDEFILLVNDLLYPRSFIQVEGDTDHVLWEGTEEEFIRIMNPETPFEDGTVFPTFIDDSAHIDSPIDDSSEINPESYNSDNYDSGSSDSGGYDSGGYDSGGFDSGGDFGGCD